MALGPPVPLLLVEDGFDVPCYPEVGVVRDAAVSSPCGSEHLPVCFKAARFICNQNGLKTDMSQRCQLQQFEMTSVRQNSEVT